MGLVSSYSSSHQLPRHRSTPFTRCTLIRDTIIRCTNKSRLSFVVYAIVLLALSSFDYRLRAKAAIITDSVISERPENSTHYHHMTDDPNHTTTTTTPMIDTNDSVSVEKFQDFMPDYIRNNGGIVVHFLILIYACLSLGIICDVYFLPSIEYIATSLNLPPDIAGATFMALGSSTPALAIALIGVFIAEDDIGTSTILGSSVFNLIFVSSVCGFTIYLSKLEPPKITKYAILRDSIYYMIAIVILLLVLKDNEIEWFESVIMLFMYAIYIVILYYNAKINQLLLKEEEVPNEQMPLNRKRRPTFSGHKGPNWSESNIFLKVLMYPIALAMKLTVPKPGRRTYFFSFGLSVVWIGLISYLDIWLVNIIGRTFHVPETVLGLTILAAGSSIPEVVSSVIVVKRGSAGGHANMAICNLFGSNIFDIMICLGLPWLLKSILIMFHLGTIDMRTTMVHVQSEGLLLTAAGLILTVIAFVGSLAFFDWRLGLGMGFACAAIYIITITFGTTFEFLFNT